MAVVQQQLLSIGIGVTIIIIGITVGFFFLMLTMRPPAESSIYYLNESTRHNNLISLASARKKELFDSALRKIAFLGMAVFLLIGIKYFLQTYELLYSPNGVAYGASYTDIHVTLIAYRVAAIVSLASAFTVAFGLLKGQLSGCFLQW